MLSNALWKSTKIIKPHPGMFSLRVKSIKSKIERTVSPIHNIATLVVMNNIW